MAASVEARNDLQKPNLVDNGGRAGGLSPHFVKECEEISECWTVSKLTYLGIMHGE